MGSEKFRYFLDNFFKGDKTIWMIYFFLCMVSIVEIYSASSNLTYKSGNHWAPLISQFVFLVIGFIIILVMHRVPCKCFKLLPYPLVIISVLLLIVTRLVGGDVNNSQRWLQMGGITFQPSELAKSALILMLALILSRSQVEVKIRNKSGVKIVSRATKNGTYAPFKKCVIYIVIVCGLICTENFSTAAILFTVAVSMMFIGNIPTKLMVKGLGTIGVLGVIAATMLIITPDSTLSSITKRAPTWKARIMNKFGGGEEEKDMSSKDVMKQENSAFIAVANSNIIGRGPGNSEERDFLYRAESDFIYAIIIEETGIFGGVLVLSLYVILLVRAGRIAQKCDKFFPAILIMGLSTMLVLQALINMGVAVGLLPVTGQTLPLISKGGSSIIITSFNIGMILSISRYAEKVGTKDSRSDEEESGEEANSLINETDEYFSSTGMD